MPDQLDSFVSERKAIRPMIYAYRDPVYPGCLKVGYTTIDVEKRVAQQYPTKRPGGVKPYEIVWADDAIREDGTTFDDHKIHHALAVQGTRCMKAEDGGSTEFFSCGLDKVKAAYLAVKTRSENEERRTADFGMRPEQREAVEKTVAYFKSAERDARMMPKFLWNAKMRFGKTFAAYQVAKRMAFKRVLILTFKPAVQSAWRDDLMQHIDFEEWLFIARPQNNTYDSIDQQYQKADKSKPIVCFGSFQDFLGEDKATGGIKSKNKWVHEINWDLVIFDEYHFGAWKENARDLFAKEDEDNYYNEDIESYNRGNSLDETWLPITADHYLYLSGTPFRALNSGEFIEEQIYNWTYSDEQRAKHAWVGEDNPYAALPRMVLLTYKMPDNIRRIAEDGIHNEFDLNRFFAASGEGNDAEFEHTNHVQKWLDLIRGSYLESSADDLKLGRGRPAMPFGDTRLLHALNHTLWFLPSVASCFAMANLLKKDRFYQDYKVNVCAGTQAGIGQAALGPVLDSMGNPLETRTITLSCGKLTTGVTVRPWSGVFMLCNVKTPETYFQTAFRVQSPWVVDGEQGQKQILKENCYIFDFALDRALKQIADYSCRLAIDETNPERKVDEFINFLPVIAYDGATMRQINAAEVLDIALAGTSATLLARRWESALLVNVDNETLTKLLNNERAMAALMNIEGFRSLNDQIASIINKSDVVKKARKDDSETAKTAKEKKQLSEEEKEIRSQRKQIQEKLIKFATRIPIFMYLSEYRECCLKDVVQKLEPSLFARVTGLSVDDFNLLCELNVFNAPLMNDAIYKFKRYEDSSLVYTGLESRHEGQGVGLYDTVLSAQDYERMNQRLNESMRSTGYVNDMSKVVESAPSQIDDDDEDLNEEPMIRHQPQSTVDPLEIKSVAKTAWIRSKTSISSEVHQNTQIQNRASTSKNTSTNIDHLEPGDMVLHKSFGTGTVVNIAGTTICVKFSIGEKKFKIPMAFEQGFLSLV